nr:restriction endonuclease subunit S [Cyanobium sp. PCC 7001]
MLSARNIERRNISYEADYRLVSLEDFERENRRTCIAAGDVLLTIVGAIGRTAVVPKGAASLTLQRSVAVLRPATGIASAFLAYALESPEAQQYMLDNAKGTAQKGIYLKTLSAMCLAIAPTTEQLRITAKLDTTLAAVDACRQRLDGVAAILKRFRQAVLAAATSGELTREWREARGIESLPRKIPLGEVIHEMRNGLSPKPSLNPPGVKILRIGAVRPGTIDWTDHRYLELSDKDLAAFRLEAGDLIFTRYNGTLEFVGACANATSIPDVYVYPDKLIRVRCDTSRALPAYVEISFSSVEIRDHIEGLVKSSAGQKGISGTDLKNIFFPLPSIEEQIEIVHQVQALFTLADQLESRLSAARKLVDRLTPALLAKAFRGALVPQDPNDEPASVLLERIRAARQAEAAAGKASRRGRCKAAANPNQLPLAAAPVPPDLLSGLLRECGALSERALLAASELDPDQFRVQLIREQDAGAIRRAADGERVMLEATTSRSDTASSMRYQATGK